MTNQQLHIESASPVVALITGVLYIVLVLLGVVIAIGLILRALRSPVDWESRINWLRERPWTWRDGAGLAAIIGLLIGLCAALTAWLHHPSESTQIVIEAILLDIAGLASIAAIVSSRGWGWRRAFGMDPTPLAAIKPGLMFYAVLMPLMIFTALIYQGILYLKGYPPSLQDVALLLAGDHPLWLRLFMIGLAIGIAPAFEECVFRGVLLPILVRKIGVGAGIFITSLLFAAIHHHLPALAPLIVVAAGLSLAYLYTGSLWVPIVMHSVFNGVNLALLLLFRH